MRCLYEGSEYRSAKQLLEYLLAYADWMHEKQIERDADCLARAAELRARPDPNGDDDAEQSVCTVCISFACSIILMPCGHFAVC